MLLTVAVDHAQQRHSPTSLCLTKALAHAEGQAI
jgi:hypothetical protein